MQSLGAITSTSRTADQTQIAQFWNPPIWVAWNNIAQTAALANHDTLMQNARLFALLNVSFANSVIGFYDAKYAYHLWRPVTAIRAADDDGNPATVGDSSWMLLTPTAQDPSYPGPHAVISAAGADVSRHVLRSRCLLVHGAVDRSPRGRVLVHELHAAENEASLSRIYAGQHFRTDEAAGQTLGNPGRRLRPAQAPVADPARQQQVNGRPQIRNGLNRAA